jgi:hypothetical protein
MYAPFKVGDVRPCVGHVAGLQGQMFPDVLARGGLLKKGGSGGRDPEANPLQKRGFCSLGSFFQIRCSASIYLTN